MNLTPEEQAVVDAMHAAGLEVEVVTEPVSESDRAAVDAAAQRLADEIDADILAQYQRRVTP